MEDHYVVECQEYTGGKNLRRLVVALIVSGPPH